MLSTLSINSKQITLPKKAEEAASKNDTVNLTTENLADSVGRITEQSPTELSALSTQSHQKDALKNSSLDINSKSQSAVNTKDNQKNPPEMNDFVPLYYGWEGHLIVYPYWEIF